MPSHSAVTYRRKANSGRTTLKQRERIIQGAICRELNKPPYEVDFYCDWASGAFLTHGQNSQRMALASRKGWVDIFIAEPRNGQHGLFLEVKREGSGAILKSGEYSTSKKLQGEISFLKRARAKGYAAEIGIGLEQCMKIINNYLGVKPALFDDDQAF